MQSGLVPDERGSIPQRSTVRFGPDGSSQGLTIHNLFSMRTMENAVALG